MALVTGTNNDDTLVGTNVDDRLVGLDGNDVLIGLGGGDRMEGGRGDDIYDIDSNSDTIIELAGEGFDRAYVSASYSLDRFEGDLVFLELLSANDHSATTPINLTGNRQDNILWGNAGPNQLRGGDGNDQLVGFDGADGLHGGTGNDYLQGGAGDDYLDGNFQADIMDGGPGNDLFFVDNAGDVVIERVGEGYDIVYTDIDYVLNSGYEIEVLAASRPELDPAIDLTGNGFNNTLRGNVGKNVLDGAGGVDSMYGGAGDDIYHVDDSRDRVVDSAGFDIVYTKVSFDATNSGAEVLSAANHEDVNSINLTGALTMWGNAGANVLTDTRVSGSVSLFGFAGNDTLIGDASDTLLDGGVGADLMIDYNGTNTFIVDNADDRVEGRGIIRTTVSYVAGNSFSGSIIVTDRTSTNPIDLTVSSSNFGDIIGNDGANVLTGGGRLQGRGGNDRLIGGTSETGDTLDGGLGSDVLDGRGGRDSFYFSTALGSDNIDTVLGFETGLNRIFLDDAIFSQLAPGTLSQSNFAVGFQNATSGTRIIYEPLRGHLYYDPDGTGSQPAVQFAVIESLASLQASDFVVY